MAEWSIAAVLKTVELQGSGGSNPSFSAESIKNQQTTTTTSNFTFIFSVKLGILF